MQARTSGLIEVHLSDNSSLIAATGELLCNRGTIVGERRTQHGHAGCVR